MNGFKLNQWAYIYNWLSFWVNLLMDVKANQPQPTWTFPALLDLQKSVLKFGVVLAESVNLLTNHARSHELSQCHMTLHCLKVWPNWPQLWRQILFQPVHFLFFNLKRSQFIMLAWMAAGNMHSFKKCNVFPHKRLKTVVTGHQWLKLDYGSSFWCYFFCQYAPVHLAVFVFLTSCSWRHYFST